MRVVEARQAPACYLLASVVDLTVVLIIGANRTVGCQFPRLVAHHALDSSIGQFRFQLQFHLGVSEEPRARRNAALRGEVTPIAQDYSQGIDARADQLRDVIGQIEDAFLVLAQRGRQHIVANLFTIQISFTQPQARHIERGALHGGIHFEFPAQHTRRQDASPSPAHISPGRHTVWPQNLGALPKRVDEIALIPLGCGRAGNPPILTGPNNDALARGEIQLHSTNQRGRFIP